MTMLAAFLAVMGEVGIPSMSVSDSLSATGSTSTITGTSRTATLPVVSPRNIDLVNLSGDGTLQLNVNSAGYTTGPWSISDGQSIQARGSGLSSVGNTAAGDLVDQSNGQIVAAITIERTS